MKRNILLFGAGRSSSTLINYLLDNSEKENWKISLITNSLSTAPKVLKNNCNIDIYEGDATDLNFISKKIKLSDIVISMLPARFHIHVAKECLKKNN